MREVSSSSACEPKTVRIAQLQEEITGLKTEIGAQERQLELITEESDTVKKLVEAGKIEIFDGGDTTRGSAGDSSAPHEATHGHAQSGIRRSGDR